MGREWDAETDLEGICQAAWNTVNAGCVLLRQLPSQSIPASQRPGLSSRARSPMFPLSSSQMLLLYKAITECYGRAKQYNNAI